MATKQGFGKEEPKATIKWSKVTGSRSQVRQKFYMKLHNKVQGELLLPHSYKYLALRWFEVTSTIKVTVKMNGHNLV